MLSDISQKAAVAALTGAFYVFPNVSALYARKFEGKALGSSGGFTEYLLDTARVAVVPGEGFGADN